MDSTMPAVPSFSNLFSRLSERIQKDGLHIRFSEEFGHLQTDRERIKFAFNLPQVQDVLQVQPLFKGKSVEEADQSRTEGNQCFQKNSLKRALHLYTKSILKAPFDSKELPLAFANRSAVLHRIEHYKLCLLDICEAMHYGYPLELKYKLFDRKAKCLFHLGHWDEMCASLHEAQQHVSQSKLSEEKKCAWISEIEKKLDQKSWRNDMKTVSCEPQYSWHIPDPIDGFSSKFPCASPAFSIAYGADKGRFAVATRDIAVGEVLVVEEPYAATLVKSYCITHCHCCFVRVVAPLPCHQCSGVVYCSSKCRSTSWSKYHYAECQFLEFIHAAEVGLGHLSMRMVLTAGSKYLLDQKGRFCVTVESTEVEEQTPRFYGSLDYQAAYSLVNHNENRSISDLFRRTATAVLLIKLLQATSFFDGLDTTVTDEDLFCIGSHILRHIMMLPCNAHEISELVLVAEQMCDSQTQEIGSGLYNTLSLINHSCDPSVVRQSYGRFCVARAIRPMKAGEEIADNYGALCALSTRLERNSHLTSQYFFECRCEACLKDWPQYFETPNELPVFKCDWCQGPVFIPDSRRTEESVCASCHGKQDITDKIVDLKLACDEYQKALQDVLEGKELMGSLPVLLNHLTRMDQLLCRPWRDYNDCQEAIKQIYNTMGNCLSQQQ